MRRLVPVMVLFAAMIAGCGEKKAPETPVTSETPTDGGEASTDASGFVNIDLSEEDEDTFAAEILQATASCGNLVALEPTAMMGKLKDAEVRCLEDSIKNAEKQTVKDKVSRVLMADSWAKQDTTRWEALVRRHLNEIDRSDPDLCYKFAKFLSGREPEYMEECTHWAEVALENKSQWKGDTFVSRVNALYKMRAVAAQRRWEWLEKKYVAKPDEALGQDKDKARNDAKTMSREWLEYAKQSGKDTTMAMQMCVSAAGTEDFCKQTD
jgi:hypothetical protein